MSEIMSYSLKYYPDPGIAFDIVRMLFVKLNPQSVWQELLTSPESIVEESDYIQSHADMLPDPPSDLLLFAFIPSNKTETFLSQYIRASINTHYTTFSFNQLVNNLSNISQIQNSLFQYYLNNHAPALCDIENLIRSNRYIPDRIKILLFGFALNPYKYISLLSETINHYFELISRNCISSSPSDSVTASFLTKLFEESHLTPSDVNVNLSFSICYTTLDYLLRNFNSPTPFFITTHSTIEKITYEKTAPVDMASILSYADALKDKHRLAIIQQLLSNSQLTLSELSKLIGLSTSTTNHHLMILRKVNIVTCSRNNRIYHYSYNPLGFQDISILLGKFEKGGFSQ